MIEAVYLLCALSSALCAALLIRSYRHQRMRLMLWSSFCFVGLALNNVIVCIDLLVVPNFDLSAWRTGIALVAVGVLVIGLVWDSP